VINYHYSYLVGTLIFGAAWIVCYIVGKSYRRQILWGTLVCTPMALSSVLFVPQYWTPPSLFNLDEKIHVGIEDFLWAAAVGGIASVVGELLLKEKLARTRARKPKKHYAPFIIMFAIFAILELWHPGKTIYNVVIALFSCAIVVAFLRGDLILLMLTSAAVFTVLYLLLFLYFLALYPDFVQRFYNVPNLLRIYVFGVPIEELMFASSFGSVWSVAYEYLQGYRLKSITPMRFEHV
jgi:hypothetical protein